MASGSGNLPTWTDAVAALFAQPYWIDPPQRSSAAAGWKSCMSGFGLELDSYDSVKSCAALIYDALESEWMPLGGAAWPPAPLETFRRWVNQGMRFDDGDPVVEKEIIPPPAQKPITFTVRRDLRSLSQEELDDYRMRLDDTMQVGNPHPAAPGQAFSAIHGEWCLHYQEAFLLWHRAYLMQFEQQIGCAVPYWNWYAQDASVNGALAGGLPSAFTDETYIHPRTGELRANPLRFAAAKNGKSKACGGSNSDPAIDCRWVQRDPVFYAPEGSPARQRKVAQILLYQQQVQRALAFTDFSHPQGPGFPWANITSFDPPPSDSEYIYRDYNFDGAYEQPHDNFHGWVGPDMADNSYTAYDPIFWSYHANIDRIFEMWLRSHPTATFTAGFPLHPFAGARAERIEFTDRRRFAYTTIGHMAQDSRALGYDFAPPVDPDFGVVVTACPSGRTATVCLSAAEPAEEELLVVFDDVRCNFASFAIDVFLDQQAATPADAAVDNPHYVGRLARIGMGQEDTRGRCITRGVPRLLNATPAAERLKIAPETLPHLTLLFVDLVSGELLPAATIEALKGVSARLVWSKAGWIPRAPQQEPTSASCCSTTPGS